MNEDSFVPRCFFRSRPVRVAFLVEDDDNAEATLDAVFANCHTRWGGRYSLVVPCENGTPRTAWLPWLEVYDPDIIYAYTDLNEADVTATHERFGPAFLTKHKRYGDPKRRDLRPELPLECLTSLSVAPQYARAHPPSAPQPMFVVDYLPGQPGDRFIDDNFGTPSGCFGRWPLPKHLADAPRPIAIAAPELLADGRRAYGPAGDTVPDTSALLHFMAERRNSFGLAQLAADSAPRIEVRDRHREAFSLVVGNTFADRVLFWNERSLMPMYLGRHFTTLIVSPERLDDERFLNALVGFLKARNQIQRSDGAPWIEVTSVSESAADLATLRDRFNATEPWNDYHVTGPIELDHCVPDAQALEQTTGLSTGRMFERSASWNHFLTQGAELRPPPTLPGHLQGVQSPSSATEGEWALDLDIERKNNLTRYSNVRHRWRLPRRLRMHGAFVQPDYGLTGHRIRYPRSTREGFLSVFTGFGEEPPTISIPDDETAFRFALERGRDWPPATRAQRGAVPSGAYRWSRPSDKGRYLIGVLRRFGSLQDCGAVLLHRFWKSVFDDLGTGIDTSRDVTIKRALMNRFPTGKIDIEDDWEYLASLIAREARKVRMPLRVLNFDELRKRHDPFLEKERRLLEEHHTENPEEWIADVQASLERSVKWLCARSVLYQGYELRCRTCYHSNWIHIGALEPVTACEVCGTSQIAPVDKPWDFRLDGFLREALKEHGLLALIWCLTKLEQRVKQTFFFLGPHDLFTKYPDSNSATGDNEIDLICVLDGKVHLCEVKSSDRRIKIEPLVKVAKRIRPDVVTLAVLKGRSGRLSPKFEKLKCRLADEGIAVEMFTGVDEDYCDHSDLHH